MTADKLVVYENHPRSSEHDASLAMKTFALNFVSAYGNLLLTSYVYASPPLFGPTARPRF